MTAQILNPSYSTSVDPFSRSSTLTDLNALSHPYDPMPSPQAWLVSSKRRTMPALLDPPESPLDLLLPVTRRLEDSQWNKRLSLLAHRYLREFGLTREDDIVEKAWKTLELFCVGEEAEESLQKFKSASFHLSPPWRELQTRSLALDKSSSWLSFPSFLDDSFNLPYSNLSFLSYLPAMDTSFDNSADPNHPQHSKRPADQRGSFQSPLAFREERDQHKNIAARVNPRYMTPTAASRAQGSTPEPRASTPPTVSSTSKRKAWMASAAKRVGIVPGTPRSKKEGRVYKRISPQKSAAGKARNRLASKDKESPWKGSPNPSAPASEEMHSINAKKGIGFSETSPMVPAKDIPESVHPEKRTAPDKPLPSLPVATIHTGSPIVRRSLIDASDKPLRKSLSPSPGEKVEEEWPTLSPSRRTTPITTPETARGDASAQAENSMTNRSGPNTLFAHVEHQDIVEAQHQPDIPAVEPPILRQGSQEDAASIQQLNGTVTVEFPKLAEKPAKDHAPIPDLTSPSTVPKNTSAPAGVATTAHVDFSSPHIQHAPSFHSGGRSRVSRLPKRLSTPGPVRSSKSPRRSASRTPSPYKPVSAHVQRSLRGKHDHLSSGVSKMTEQAKVHTADHTIDVTDVTPQAHPSLIAIKQSSKSSHDGSGRSSIPRPHHKFQLRRDAESETEIVVRKLPKEKRSTRLSDEHKSDDGDLDTDEAADNREDKKVPRGPNLADGDEKTGEWIEKGRSKMSLAVDAAFPKEKEESAPRTTIDSRPDRDPLSTTVGDHQVDSLPAAKSVSADSIQSDTVRQRERSNKPYDRIKRLSATAPEHGPILRISDSAENIIMGHGSEQGYDDDDASARKHNSVPDLRRSAIVKELRKSAENLLNGNLPLSRSTTTRSLTSHERKVQVGETSNAKELSGSSSQPQSGTAPADSSISEDPFSARNDKRKTSAHRIARKPTPSGRLDWPLKALPQSPADLRPVREYSGMGGDSWISQPQGPHIAEFPDQKSMPAGSNGRGSRSAATDSAGSAGKKQHFESSHRPTRGDISSIPIEKNSLHAKPNSLRSPVQRNAQFPPRTSSRTNTPDVSVRSRAQINYFSTRGIPNRFESAHPRRLSEDFSLPKSMTLDPETLRNSVHELKDAAKSQVSTPAAREGSRPQFSSAKGMLSNIKGLFNKRSIETSTAAVVKTRVSDFQAKHATVTGNGSPNPSHHSRTLPARHGSNREAHGGVTIVPTPKDAFPRPATCRVTLSQNPVLDTHEYRQATDLAMRVLDTAREESDAFKRNKLMQYAELMVEAVTGARNAEKATEEAKQAASRAEMHSMRTKKSVLELTKLVGKELDGDWL